VPENFDKDRFFHPTGRYRGNFTPTNLAFNANLQEFASRVSLICGLETGGKISQEQAYEQIRRLWEQLETSKEELLDRDPPEPPELPQE
jgi:hypothetical protein